MCPPAGSTHRCSPTSGDFTMRYGYEISKFLISSESPKIYGVQGACSLPGVWG